MVLENQIPEADAELAETIQYMQRKFRRYWKLTWLQIAFPVIFDPRFKLKFIDFRLKQAFGSDAEAKIEIVKKTLLDLFKDYSDSQETTQAPSVTVQTNASGRYADWDNHVNLNAQPTNEVPSELESYLSKPAIPRSDGFFDILGWWRSNALEYQLCPEWLEMLWWPLLHQLHSSQHSTMRRDLSQIFEAAYLQRPWRN